MTDIAKEIISTYLEKLYLNQNLAIKIKPYSIIAPWTNSMQTSTHNEIEVKYSVLGEFAVT